nr:hypothetical protein [Tanacetum cinerariifolium]
MPLPLSFTLGVSARVFEDNSSSGSLIITPFLLLMDVQKSIFSPNMVEGVVLVMSLLRNNAWDKYYEILIRVTKATTYHKAQLCFASFWSHAELFNSQHCYRWCTIARDAASRNKAPCKCLRHSAAFNSVENDPIQAW